MPLHSRARTPFCDRASNLFRTRRFRIGAGTSQMSERLLLNYNSMQYSVKHRK